MHTSLEDKRRLLEDLELLDYAITKRIRLNSKVYQPDDPKMNHHILTENCLVSEACTKLQQHEIKKLFNKYQTERLELVKLLSDDDAILRDLKDLKDPKFEEGDFSSFLTICQSEIGVSEKDDCSEDHDIYDLFSSNNNYKEIKRNIENLENPVSKRTHWVENRTKSRRKLEKSILKSERYNVLSSYTSDLNLSVLFTPAEIFGSQLDLKAAYRQWLSLPRQNRFPLDSIPKYRHYLNQIKKRDETIEFDSPQYSLYLKELLSYLESYIQRSHPLEEHQSEIESTSQFECPELFCLACNKLFSKDSVYHSHLQGRKHLNASKRHMLILQMESKIATLFSKAEHLKIQLENTIHDTEREELLTVRERELEKQDESKTNKSTLTNTAPLSLFYGSDWKLISQKLNQDINDEDSSDEELDEKLTNPLNIPLGLDGRPIPFWLYKLKGLKYEFDCEICKSKFKGRGTFIKHFKDENHINGLRELGVERDFHDFRDLSKVEEVTTLLATIKAKTRNEAQFLDDSLQVEDDQGNAMSKKVYDQLSKQGLL